MGKMKLTSTLILIIFIFSSLSSLGFIASTINALPIDGDGYVYITGTTDGIELASVKLTIRSMKLFNFGEIIYEQYRATNSIGYYNFEDAVAGIKDLEVTKACYSSYFGAFIDPVYLDITGYQYTIYGSIMNDTDLVSDATIEITDGITTKSTITQYDGCYSLTFLYETNGVKNFDINVTHSNFDNYFDELSMSAPGSLQHNIQLYFEELHPAPDNPNLWALIIGSGTADRFTRDAFGMYKTLTNWYGFMENQTILLTDRDSIDGENVPRDNMTYHKNISYAFSCLNSNVDNDDTVIIWWTGHGDTPTAAIPYDHFLLPDDTYYLDPFITPTTLNNYISQITCDEMYVFLGPCYSGRFLDDLEAPYRFVYTSTTDEEGEADDGHSLWSFATYKGLNPELNLDDADTNENGMVSLDELFTYCYNYVSIYQTPNRYPDDPIEASTYIYDQPF